LLMLVDNLIPRLYRNSAPTDRQVIIELLLTCLKVSPAKMGNGWTSQQFK